MIKLSICFLLMFAGTKALSNPHIQDLLTTETALSTEQPIHSWIEARDHNVVKQQFDTSCGAASLATVLNVFYGEDTNEADLMDIMGLKGAYSFADLSYASSEFGYKATPVFAQFDILKKLRVPVILFINNFGQGHFTVFRGTDGETIWLGDPAWGNVYLSKRDFEKRWNQIGSGEGTGFALIILKPEQDINTAFFGLSNAERRRFFIQNPNLMSGSVYP